MANFKTFYDNVLSKDIDGSIFEKKFVKWFVKNHPDWQSRIKKICSFEDWPDK